VSKLRGNKVTLALAMGAILLISAGLLGTIMASALIPSSQATTSTANTTAGRTGGGNNAAVGSGNDTTMISSMCRICSPTANKGAEAADAIEMSSNTANTGATNASNGTMQGHPNPIITMSATSGDNTIT
jgi:hypothetical protein